MPQLARLDGQTCRLVSTNYGTKYAKQYKQTSFIVGTIISQDAMTMACCIVCAREAQLIPFVGSLAQGFNCVRLGVQSMESSKVNPVRACPVLQA